MRATPLWPEPVFRSATAWVGSWLRRTTVAGLAAGLAGTVATSVAVDAWARWFDRSARRLQ